MPYPQQQRVNSQQLLLLQLRLRNQLTRYDQQAAAVSTTVEQTYWDLYAAERNFAVQQLIRNQAEALLNETELRAKSGLVGPNQVANARTFLAEQELLLLDREEQLDSQSDMLASLIGVRPDPGMLRFIPYDNPPYDFTLENTETLIESALKNNLDLQAAQHDIEAINVQSNAAKWQSLPALNLVGSIGGSGLAGTPQDVIFQGEVLRASRSGSFSDALSQVSKREFPNWNIGFELNIPIGFRQGLGEKDRLEALVSGAQQQYTELSRSIEEQVRSAWREVNNGKRRINAAAEGVSAAQEQVRIGLIEFHNGRSTAFELVRLGADLAAAQQRYSEALVRTAKAAASLRSLTSGNYTGAK
jgi:outer membrane protein TolC